jgi:predicted transcriptional regulator
MSTNDPRVSCPVCGLVAKDKKGLATHFRHRREAGDLAHPEFLAHQEEAQWDGKIEGTDYVRCLSCGLRTLTLARHLKAAHKISADEYRTIYGPKAKIRCDSLTDRRSIAIAARVLRKGEKKTVFCPSCGESWEGSKYLVPGTHDFRCDRCRTQEEAASEVERWVGKSEPEDYVTCRACGYRAENLTSHLQSIHPELLGTYREVYLGALINALISGVRDKTMIRGVPRSEEFAQKVSAGKVTQFSVEDYLPFRMKNGKVSVGRASQGLGKCESAIRRECVRLGLPSYRWGVCQDRFLGTLSKLLGCEYEAQWTSPLFVNPKSNRRFKFDGFFEDIGLLVEFQGHQHYTFPNRFHSPSHETTYLECRERDAEKRRQVLADGRYKYLEVREDQSWDDLEYLQGRLTEIGTPFVRLSASL